MKKTRFAYLSAHDPRDKKVWSGTLYSIYRSLCGLGDVEILGPYQPKGRMFIGKIVNQILLNVFNKRWSYRHSVFVCKGYASYFEKKLRDGNYDFIIAPAASGEIAYLKTTIPIIYITDGTFARCLNYHKSLSGLTGGSVKDGNTIEQNAISKSSHVIVSSQWAANSVLNDYKYPKDKLTVLPYGANLEKLPVANELDMSAPKTWKLLFVGVYWEDKGGDIVFNCFKLLLDKGYDVELTVVGCIPPKNIQHPKLKVIEFLDKNSEEGQKKLNEIYKQHHFLLLPTRFDCSPIVINEASAFGVPAIVAKTGGVEGHLKEGVNGFLADYDDKGEQYAQHIETMINAPEAYLALRKSTRQLYEEKLNWEVWSKEFRKICDALH